MELILSILYVIGIIAESMTGALAAGRQRMDLFGVLIIGCCTALGGGSARDILLGTYPLRWVAHPQYIVITAFAAIITVYVFASFMHRLRMLFFLLDALGLVVFTIIGTQEALKMGFGYLVASIAGIVTGVFGSIMRDIFCNQIPLIFKSELYASVSFLCSWLYIGLFVLSVDPLINVLTTLFFGFSLRMLSVWFHWEVPKFEYDGQ